jgi:hypothetical protein
MKIKISLTNEGFPDKLYKKKIAAPIIERTKPIRQKKNSSIIKKTVLIADENF